MRPTRDHVARTPARVLAFLTFSFLVLAALMAALFAGAFGFGPRTGGALHSVSIVTKAPSPLRWPGAPPSFTTAYATNGLLPSVRVTFT
jgi:hypothetical protein